MNQIPTAVIAFDIHGLIDYPGYFDRIYGPISNFSPSIKMGYLTLMLNQNDAEKRLELACHGNIGDFVLTTSSFSGVIDALNQSNRELLTKLLTESRLPAATDVIDRILSMKSTQDLEDKRFSHKYLPLLAALFNVPIQNVLMVESDGGLIQDFRESETGGSLVRVDRYLDYFERSKVWGSSVILVPEYPQLWETHHVAVDPQSIVNRVGEIIGEWVVDPKPTHHDLGIELGIYTEQNRLIDPGSTVNRK